MVVVRLKLVEVLTLLFLETILAVEDELEGAQWTSSFFGVIRGRGLRIKEWDTTRNADWDVAVGGRTAAWVVLENDFGIVVGGGEVPERRTGEGVGETPDQFLDWVVVGQSNLLGRVRRDRIGASVLHLLDQVFVTLLGESSTLFSVEVDVVGPHLEDGRVQVRIEFRSQVKVDSDFVVLQGNQWQGQSWVAVEEEDQWQVNLRVVDSRRSHLTVALLLGFIQVQFSVQSPPLLVVLVNSLTTDRQFNILDRRFRDPGIFSSIEGLGSLQFNVHVRDQITISGDRDGNATIGRGSTVDSLFDVFHRKVSVAFVNRLEEGDFWVTSQVDILGAIGDELHETTGHFVCFLYYIPRFFFQVTPAKKHNLIFPGKYK